MTKKTDGMLKIRLFIFGMSAAMLGVELILFSEFGHRSEAWRKRLLRKTKMVKASGYRAIEGRKL